MISKDEIIALFNSNRLDEASAALHAADADPAWSAFMQGRIEWKQGHKAAAISLYNEAVRLDPSSEAATALEQALKVMEFYNKDLYNP